MKDVIVRLITDFLSSLVFFASHLASNNVVLATANMSRFACSSHPASAPPAPDRRNGLAYQNAL